MTNSKSLPTLGFALACAALTFCLAVRAQAQTVTFLAKFQGVQASATGVIQATDGNFYGVAGGGAHDRGQVFRMTPSGELTTLYSFCSQIKCTDGEYPQSVPTLGSDGNLYGVTSAGGNNFAGQGAGIIWKMTLDGQFTILYTFCPSSGCADGVVPSGIIQASDGNFYGTTSVGGKGVGTIFQISPTGQFKLLYTFCSLAKCTDGANPGFPPLQGSDGNFYGVTSSGGTGKGGVIYELTPSGTYSVIYNFCNGGFKLCQNGASPTTIAQDANGNFFGTTEYGGLFYAGAGTVFEFSSTHQYSVLHKFDTTDGALPYARLTLASDGNLYGTTLDGGAGNGTIFEITPAGEFTSLYSFTSPLGYDPAAGPLFQGSDGDFYGATQYGPAPCCYGTIFKLSNGLSPLVKTVPVAAKAGKQVIILGNGLTGSTNVTFNGIAAEYTVVSDTYIKATVPAGATTGPVSVVTPSGTLNSNPPFVVTR
ncbi:MAG TPA: choice-of-anchor tandem repeat GloVer-containing protein [Candidatus Dormibacteraeota bacterium]|nr:choice-of-anchor tandem repeat GloVer-containing protein [Candidatus Dormibacteraeota bacterium]